MINQEFFFATVRKELFDGKLSPSQVAGLNAILGEWISGAYGKDDRWLAYVLATAHHETDRKMQPIEEYGKGKGLPYGKKLNMLRKPYADTTAIFYGRGFVQLTWYENYKKAGTLLKLDLLHKPELVLGLPVATEIMFNGMIEGWFTGKKLSDYFNSDKEDWVNARRIINGTDRAQLVASYALKYYAALSHKA